jgi:hypothetical protein
MFKQALPTPGETFKLKGQWVIIDVNFGQQFLVENCLPVLPAAVVSTAIEGPRCHEWAHVFENLIFWVYAHIRFSQGFHW